MEPDVGALATQQGAVDLERSMILGQVTRDGREMLMVRTPDGEITYVDAGLMPAAEVGGSLSDTASETLLAGEETLEEPLPGPPPAAAPPMSEEEVRTRVADLEAAMPPVDPNAEPDLEQRADEGFFGSEASPFDAMAYMDLAKLARAPQYRFNPPSAYRPRRSNVGARALQRLGIASLV